MNSSQRQQGQMEGNLCKRERERPLATGRGDKETVTQRGAKKMEVHLARTTVQPPANDRFLQSLSRCLIQLRRCFCQPAPRAVVYGPVFFRAARLFLCLYVCALRLLFFFSVRFRPVYLCGLSLLHIFAL